jgi:GNAT superfamily N-acetyltransferase
MADPLFTIACLDIPEAQRRFIDDFRRAHDHQAALVLPHFTLVFGAADIDEPAYLRHVETIAQAAAPIRFHCRCATLGADERAERAFVYLVPDEGHAAIALLHDRLYGGPLAPSLRLQVPYTPHITIGSCADFRQAKAWCDALNGQGVDVAGMLSALTVGTLRGGSFQVLRQFDLMGPERRGHGAGDLSVPCRSPLEPPPVAGRTHMSMGLARPAAVRFVPTDPVEHRADLIALNVEYLDWVLAGIERDFGTPAQEVLGQSIPDYVAGKIESVCGALPPQGVFYLVRLDGALAGMGGLRHVRDGVAELKRVYVRPACRGVRLGATIIERLLADARAFGYREVWLDSAPFMASAHRLYEAAGFNACAPYPETEVPPQLRDRWRFMARVL